MEDAKTQRTGGPIVRSRDEKEARAAQRDQLARDVLDEQRQALMVAYRFLDAALWRMPGEPVEAAASLATDGRVLGYNANVVLGRFAADPLEMMRDYLHTLFHCIFRQPFDDHHPDRDAWQLACDIVVEASCIEVCGTRFPSPDDEARKTAVSQLEMLFGTLTPHKLYQVFELHVKAPELMAAKGVSEQAFKDWFALFYRDDHFMWASSVHDDRTDADPAPEATEAPDAAQSEGPEAAASAGPQQAGGSDAADADEPTSEGEPLQESEPQNDQPDDDGEGAGTGAADIAMAGDEAPEDHSEDEHAWEEIAKRVEMDLKTYSSAVGEGSTVLMANLAHVNAKRVDFGAFLRRFATMGEDMRVNDDEFDYLFYTYGLKLYGNMPLVEPLEYKESERVREFVIALDTSESCQGELVKNFVRYTATILAQTEAFGEEVNIHIVQCDTRVQSDTRIDSLAALDHFLDRFAVYGMGGTDFRPVFDYVERLRETGEFENLKGLIYFTDGKGTFPEHRPPYETAFVFYQEPGQETPGVPPWASKVVLDDERMAELRLTGANR